MSDITISFNSEDQGWQTIKLLHALYCASSSSPLGLDLHVKDRSQSGDQVSQGHITDHLTDQIAHCTAVQACFAHDGLRSHPEGLAEA